MSTGPTQPPSADPGRQPTEEEMRAAYEQELKRVRVEQVVLESAISVLNIAVLRAGMVPDHEGDRDLEQVRVGIEAVRGLLPVIEQIAGEQARPIRDALSQLQMAYVQAMEAEAGAGAAGAAPPSGGPAGDQGRPAAPPQPRPGQTGPAQRSRLWVPGQ